MRGRCLGEALAVPLGGQENIFAARALPAPHVLLPSSASRHYRGFDLIDRLRVGRRLLDRGIPSPAGRLSKEDKLPAIVR